MLLTYRLLLASAAVLPPAVLSLTTSSDRSRAAPPCLYQASPIAPSAPSPSSLSDFQIRSSLIQTASFRRPSSGSALPASLPSRSYAQYQTTSAFATF